MPDSPSIPGYTIVSKIADGGMATVWKARQDQLDRVVAIKILTREVDDDQEYQRFIYEARAAASLIHPNIVQVIDAGEQHGFMYYIMEYVPGPTAGDIVDSGNPMEEPKVLDIAREVAEALDYAWREHHVVHCDIKPENLLLHRNGRTKVADLGLAQVTGKETVRIDDDMTLGTPNYFPPEQALVEENLDCRADMYALGATLYHLATGEVPFGELPPEEVASQQVHGQLINPRELNPKISFGLACLIRRLMAKRPGHRYSDWGAVLADIQAVKEGGLPAERLGSEIDSTIEPIDIPLAVLQSAARMRLKTGGQEPGVRVDPPRRRGAGQIQMKAQVHAVRLSATDVARLHARKKPQHKHQSLWPMVLLLALLTVVLYSTTYMRMK